MARLKRLLPQVAVIAVLGALALTLGVALGDPALEITVRPREIAFHVRCQSAPYSSRAPPPARRVRLTFVNEDIGVDHDLVLEGLGVISSVLPGDGSSQVLRFKTPDRPIDSTYTCSLHLRMMSAALRVRAGD